MSFLAFLPAAILGAVFCAVVCVCLWVERAERRRAGLHVRPRLVFRPVVIQGGKAEMPAAPRDQASDGDKFSSNAKRPNRL
jgi:hypothetical protein